MTCRMRAHKLPTWGQQVAPSAWGLPLMKTTVGKPQSFLIEGTVLIHPHKGSGATNCITYRSQKQR